MKKMLKLLVITLLMGVLMYNNQALASTSIDYTYKKVIVDGKYSDIRTNKSYKKIIRTYKQLAQVKKYVKKKYKNPNKYLKRLNKYKKSYFKKNALVFVTENIDVHTHKYKLASVTLSNNKIYLNIKKYNTLKSGESATCVVEYKAKTYFVNVKKSKIRKAKNIKTKYYIIRNNTENI